MIALLFSVALADDVPAAPAEGASRPKNANLSVTLTRADGSNQKLAVTGIERSIDFMGDQGWSSEAKDLLVTIEIGSTEKNVAWTDIKSVAIAPAAVTDADCTYSSDFSPWMYECTLKTTANLVMKDGSKGVVNNRHKWRFTTGDGAAAEFWLYKHTAREQDEPSENGENEEDMGMYTKLQDQLRTEVKTTLVKSVAVN
ncbi:MAG: hypothetical protein FJ090_01690 [Deltaproteobacteria bacterium]|nr:hypothetical protein [Deltaproteobacteria bacterium]